MIPAVAWQHPKECARKMEKLFTRGWSKKRNIKAQVCPSAEWKEALAEGWGAALPELSYLSLVSQSNKRFQILVQHICKEIS